MNVIIVIMMKIIRSMDVVKLSTQYQKNPLRLKKISTADFLLGKFRSGKELAYFLVDSRME